MDVPNEVRTTDDFLPFRPCAMVVPDFEMICEIMLVSEGFLEARLLARKFITLYSLCKELLSKQDHYDWGLRAIKSVLVVAGALKRSDPGRPEDQVLMRALRDFNIPKIVTDDMPIFMGLIGDLFPALDVPRKRNPDMEKQIKQAVLDLKLQPEDSFVLKVSRGQGHWGKVELIRFKCHNFRAFFIILLVPTCTRVARVLPTVLF